MHEREKVGLRNATPYIYMIRNSSAYPSVLIPEPSSQIHAKTCSICKTLSCHFSDWISDTCLVLLVSFLSSSLKGEINQSFLLPKWLEREKNMNKLCSNGLLKIPTHPPGFHPTFEAKSIGHSHFIKQECLVTLLLISCN